MCCAHKFSGDALGLHSGATQFNLDQAISYPD